jgi:sigma-B regulation protein RsbU (phosphoserine phosphatase)
MSDPVLELRFRAAPQELRDVRAAVRKQALEAGCSEDVAHDIVMAVDEACQNIIRHAYGREREGDIELRIEREGDALVLYLVDFAPRTDPEKVKPRELDDVRPGGLGTFLIRELMDSAEFLDPPPGCGNLLRMVKRIT